MEITQPRLITDPSGVANWNQRFLNRLRRGSRRFGPAFCYTCEYAGKHWIRRSKRGIAAPSAQPDLAHALFSVLSPALSARSLTIVDLGIGDMVRVLPILRKALEHSAALHFVMVDINQDLLRSGLSGVDPAVSETLHGFRKQDRLTCLHCDYRFLRRYAPLLQDSERTCFLMLGNTLGIEQHPARVLRRLRNVLRSGDQIILELQAVEPGGLTDLELTLHFRQDLEFYAGPLLAAGVPREFLDVEASTTMDKGMETIGVDVLLSNTVALYSGLILQAHRYRFMSISKFGEEAVRRTVALAGFDLRKLIFTEADRALGRRPFFYVNAEA